MDKFLCASLSLRPLFVCSTVHICIEVNCRNDCKSAGSEAPAHDFRRMVSSCGKNAYILCIIYHV